MTFLMCVMEIKTFSANVIEKLKKLLVTYVCNEMSLFLAGVTAFISRCS